MQFLLPAETGRLVCFQDPSHSVLPGWVWFSSLGLPAAPLLSTVSASLLVMSSPLDQEHIKARYCVCYQKLGFAAVTNNPQSCVASNLQGSFLPHIACPPVASFRVIFTMGSGRRKNPCVEHCQFHSKGEKKDSE